MNRILTGFLVLFFSGPPLWAADESKEKPSTPAEQYKALDAEYQAAQKEYQDAMRKATTKEERQKLSTEKAPQVGKFITGFMELAEKNPKDPAAVDSLIWVINHSPAFGTTKNSPKAQALEILLSAHLDSVKLPTLFRQMANATDKTTETFLRSAMEKSSHREIQGQACLALARYLGRRASTLERVRSNPKMLKSYESMLGKEYLEELLKQDPKEADKEIENLFDRVVEKYAGVKESPARPGLPVATLGDIAKKELFSIRNLAIGKPVPDIEGEDLDSKKFKLSDYRGKVVMLDFWGHW
jgi:hypothetical protein